MAQPIRLGHKLNPLPYCRKSLVEIIRILFNITYFLFVYLFVRTEKFPLL